MQLKFRHLLLFIIACSVLIFSGLPGASLLAMCSLMQMALLIHGLELTKKSQITALKLFFISVPLFLFWGGIHSFVNIYLNENQYLFFITSLLITFGLTFLLCVQTVLPYTQLKENNYEALKTIQSVFNDIKNKKTDFLKITSIFFVFSFFPWLKTDWKLVFATMALHLYLNRAQLKRVISNF